MCNSQKKSNLIYTRRQFIFQDQIEFANLSGDFNPIHIDPVDARRSNFGQLVVHGIHSIIWALNSWSKENEKSIYILNIKGYFPRPIFLDTIVECRVILNENSHLKMELYSNGNLCTIIDLEFNSTPIKRQENVVEQSVIDEFPQKCEPIIFSKDNIIGNKGVIDYFFKKNEFARLFPYVFSNFDSNQMAALIGATRLVGMKCPGLYSLFSSLELSFENTAKSDLHFDYKVIKFDKRFGLVDMILKGNGFSGSIKSFLRPTPVQQLDFKSIKTIVRSDEFEGQKALIIGGSRGIGEVTAKILAAGGAHVMISYNIGKLDAIRVVQEIVSNGGKAEYMYFNVLESDLNEYLNSNDDWIPTHCYYFATPFIFSGKKGVFSEKLFTKFCSYYLQGFYNIVEILYNKGVNKFFYPSSISIDELPMNMIEYTMSKVAGEKMCDFLLLNHEKLDIYKPKLPRLATDQTVSFIPVKNQDSILVALQHVRIFHVKS